MEKCVGNSLKNLGPSQEILRLRDVLNWLRAWADPT